MSNRREPSDRWVPDARTIHWAFGRSHEDRIKDAIRLDVRERGRDLDPDSDDYWKLLTEVAIEAVLYDLVDMAKEEGTAFTSDTYRIVDEPGPRSSTWRMK